MKTTSTIGCGTRRSLRTVVVPTAMLLLSLTACGDKEAPVTPSHEVQLAEAREAAEREKAARQLAEDRFGKLLVASVLGVGGALALGRAMGSPSRRKSEGAESEGVDAEGADIEGAHTEGAKTEV